MSARGHQGFLLASGDPAWANVSSLLHFDGVNGSTSFIDQISANVWTGGGTPSLSPAQSKFGGSSLALNGLSSINTPASTRLNLVSGDFTVECFFYAVSTTGVTELFSKDGMYQTSYPQYNLEIASGKLRANFGTGNGITMLQTLTGITSIATSAWHHAAIVRKGTKLYMFLDGGLEVSTTQTATMIDGGKALYLGYQQGQPSSIYFNGFIDEFRLTKGVARYSANFTPPSVSFPDQ